jgi:hypothetical protein
MIYELRTYDFSPMARSALYNRFEHGTLDLVRRHGIDLVSAWEPSDGRERLYSLYRWPDANAREAAWYRFRTDPDWQVLKATSERDGPLVSRYDACLLHDAPFMRGRRA